ncbi:substrate-binding periplasmic protein [Salidesulfovibrio onnuriiensis]|uniref:substrate-binding periplasmic protein n=1 Tax=Salidesulfovibrio onnuriiensis TaxID=2583823 RepID=UPI0011CAF1A2|nr:transporter substrate-binding domain-containing protein [Salidesulfovibrio onnuriiensis]
MAMLRLSVTLLLAFHFLAAPAHAYDLDKLRIYTDDYPPYNYKVHGKIQGQSTAKIRKILKRLGATPERENIQLVPWARAYAAVQADRNAVIYSMVYTEQRAPLFRWACPLGTCRISLIAAKKRAITITSIEDLEHYRIGVVREGIGHQLVSALVPDLPLDITSTPELNVRKLHAGRLDLFAFDYNVASHVMRTLEIDPAEYEEVFTLDEQKLCIGFNKEADPALVNDFQRELDALNEETSHAQNVQ